MGYYSWDASYSVDVETIDAQHQQLFALLNQVADAVENMRLAEGINEVLPKLVDYTGYHFDEEEKKMNDVSYPDTASHKVQHDTFKAKLDEMAETAKQAGAEDRAVLTLDMLKFLNDWLVQHIGQVDKKLGAFLKEKGIK